MDDYKFIIDNDDDAINLENLDTSNLPLSEKEEKEQEELVLKSLRQDYISFLREYYEADDKLFDMVEELLEESNEQEKLMKILDSL